MTAGDRSERRLELKVGAFAIGVLLLGVAVVLLLGQQHHVFQPRATLHAAFPDVGGLREGAPVWLSGVSVGSVTKIRVGRAGERVVRVQLEVSRDMLDRIHRDSVAVIGSQGLLGDKMVEISLGSVGSPELHDGDSIRTEAPADFNKLVDQANAILERAKQVADNAAVASKALADPKTINEFRGSLKAVHALLEQVQTGPGLAHALFYDRRTADDLQQLTAELDRIATHVDGAVKKVDTILSATDEDGKQLVNNLSRAAKSVGQTADAVSRSKMIANLDRTSSNLVAITDYVRDGKGTLGSLIVDPTVYEQLVQVLGGVQRSRILRTLVRYAISRDEKKANQPSIEAKTMSAPPAVPKPNRAKR